MKSVKYRMKEGKKEKEGGAAEKEKEGG